MRVEGAKNDVQGNRIGTHISGTVAVPNGSGGVLLSGGNANKVAGNLISGNTTGPGVEAHGTAPASVITGNLIGTSTSGAAPLPNHVGIRIGSAGNQIGGTTSAARNVISGNAQHGIDAHAGAADLRIQGNLIGAGVWIEGDDSSIGGDKPEVPPNTIWDNVGEGVYVTPSGVGNAILRNSIHHNGGLGIDLDPVGVAGIDFLDPDVGANDQQNYAIITSANTVGGQTIIGWTSSASRTPNSVSSSSSTPPATARTARVAPTWARCPPRPGPRGSTVARPGRPSPPPSGRRWWPPSLRSSGRRSTGRRRSSRSASR